MQDLWQQHKKWLQEYSGALNLPKVMELWYVRFPKAVALTQVFILGITSKTVSFGDTVTGRPVTYLRSEIEFIEKVENEK